MLVFEERGKPEYPEKNLSEQLRKRTNNKLNPHMALRARFSKVPVTRNDIFYTEVSGKVGCVLTSNKVHFVSLADNLLHNFQSF